MVGGGIPLTFVYLISTRGLHTNHNFCFVYRLPISRVFRQAFFPMQRRLFTMSAFVFFTSDGTILQAHQRLVRLFRRPMEIRFQQRGPNTQFCNTIANGRFFVAGQGFGVFGSVHYYFHPTRCRQFTFNLPVTNNVGRHPLRQSFANVNGRYDFRTESAVHRRRLL